MGSAHDDSLYYGQVARERLQREFEAIPFDDDADCVKTWKGLALSAIMDLRRYAYDEMHHRRIVSAEGYEADAVRIEQSLT